MCLVVVAAVEGQTREIVLRASLQAPQGLLEPQETAIDLWRDPDLIAEYLDEPPLAEPRPAGDRRDGDRARGGPDFPQGERNRRMARQRAGGALQQERLEEAEPFGGIHFLEQPIAQAARMPSPPLVEGDDAPAELAGRRFHERKGAARPEVRTDHDLGGGRVDDERVG